LKYATHLPTRDCEPLPAVSFRSNAHSSLTLEKVLRISTCTYYCRRLRFFVWTVILALYSECCSCLHCNQSEFVRLANQKCAGPVSRAASSNVGYTAVGTDQTHPRGQVHPKSVTTSTDWIFFHHCASFF